MKAVLLTDFGSTNTKVTAVDLDGERLLGTATAYTTVETDVALGQAAALAALEEQTGKLDFFKRFACSSAAGGLKMVASGLVPSLTAEAARLACLGAGAKIARVYSYELTQEDIDEIDAIGPDIFLLTGGTDGGDRDCIVHNAGMIAGCRADFPVLLAGNRNAAAKCQEILKDKKVVLCPNVMPSFGKINIEPVQDEIRDLFLKRIILAKGLSAQQGLVSGILMPTPSAVKAAMELLASDMGELVAVDLGGATTDVYSVAEGLPENEGILLKGLPEPKSKRTVEGDIGMRYSALGILAAKGGERIALLSGLDAGAIDGMVEALNRNPSFLPEREGDHALDFALAALAVETAVARHAGVLEQIYTLSGPAFVQTGKDLRRVNTLVLTGGAVIHNRRAPEIASFAGYSQREPLSLRPENPTIFIDRSYILSAMGLLAEEFPKVALSIMKKELKCHGTAK